MRKESTNHKRGMIPSGLPCRLIQLKKRFCKMKRQTYIFAFRPHAKIMNLLPRKNKKNLLHWTKWIQMGALTWEKVCQLKLKSRRLCSPLLPFLGLEMGCAKGLLAERRGISCHGSCERIGFHLLV